MDGRKRAWRRRAAVWGLACLMGISVVGCHAGPRLFSKRSSSAKSPSKSLADRSKFINRQKSRPEADYLREELSSDEQLAGADSAKRSVSRSRPSDTAPERGSDQVATTRSARNRSDSDVRQSARGRKSEIIDDSFFDESPVPAKTTGPSVAKTAQSSRLHTEDEDPFKHSVVASASGGSKNDVAPVDFRIQDGWRDNSDEADEEQEELLEQANQAESAVNQAASRIAGESPAAAASNQRKFLPAESEIESPTPSLNASSEPGDESGFSPIAKSTTKSSADVRQTIDAWRREMARDDDADGTPLPAPAPRGAASPKARPAARGHLHEVDLEDLAPQRKSQGAVLNGELIIDTSTLPARFQRGTTSAPAPSAARNADAAPSGLPRRMSSNSGASVEKTDDSAVNGVARRTGQITLQSLSVPNGEAESSDIATAVFEQTKSSMALSHSELPDIFAPIGSGAGTIPDAASDRPVDGPRLSPFAPDECPAVSNIAKSESSLPLTWQGAELDDGVGARGWRRWLLILGGMASAMLIGLGVRRRMDTAPIPLRVRHTETPRRDPTPDLVG